MFFYFLALCRGSSQQTIYDDGTFGFCNSRFRHDRRPTCGSKLLISFYTIGVSLAKYFQDAMKQDDGRNFNCLLQRITLHGNSAWRAKIIEEACAILRSWMHCFLENHAANLSWGGKLELSYFILLDGKVYVVKPPKFCNASHSVRLLDCNRIADLNKISFVLDGNWRQAPDICVGLLQDLYRIAVEKHIYWFLKPIFLNKIELDPFLV